jgi:hypothetical protein
LIPVIFKRDGGSNQQLKTSVELLQANNLATTTTDSEACAYFENTVIDFVATNAFETFQLGSKVLHLLSLEIQPVRCPFQDGPSGLEDTLGAAVCKNSNTPCQNILSQQDCDDYCTSWLGKNEKERVDFYEQFYGVRPSMIMPEFSGANSTYTNESGEVVEAEFYVKALFYERLAVKRS